MPEASCGLGDGICSRWGCQFCNSNCPGLHRLVVKVPSPCLRTPQQAAMATEDVQEPQAEAVAGPAGDEGADGAQKGPYVLPEYDEALLIKVKGKVRAWGAWRCQLLPLNSLFRSWPVPVAWA